MRVLVLGASGMLGSAVYDYMRRQCDAWGALRDVSAVGFFDSAVRSNLIAGVDVLDHDCLVDLLARVRPQVIVNCVGLVKQNKRSKSTLAALPVNSMFPHRLAELARLIEARVIHVSTDCVFSGEKGGYVESDRPDAVDVYGLSKYLGELVDYDNCITLRTSIIGHGLRPNDSLVDWFLSQSGSVNGYRNAVFSGLPTVELARVISDYVLPRPEVRGLYHVSADPIDKCSLLGMVASAYEFKGEIVPRDEPVVDRSLNGERFRREFAYRSKAWPKLVEFMRDFRITGRV